MPMVAFSVILNYNKVKRNEDKEATKPREVSLNIPWEKEEETGKIMTGLADCKKELESVIKAVGELSDKVNNLMIEVKRDNSLANNLMIEGKRDNSHVSLDSKNGKNGGEVNCNEIKTSTTKEIIVALNMLTTYRKKPNGYKKLELLADATKNTRGLITFVKNNIPAELIVAERINDIEYRNRYRFKNETHKKKFMKYIENWYEVYRLLEVNDENEFYEDFLRTIDEFFNIVKQKAKEIKETLENVATLYTEIRKEVRGKYWNEHLSNLFKLKNLSMIWDNVNKIRGIKKKAFVHPNPIDEVRRLKEKWEYIASFDSLPLGMRNYLKNREHFWKDLFESQGNVEDDTCIPINRDEILYALNTGKSTAPGEDGVPYDILNCLVMLKNSPLVDLFNLSYTNRRLPRAWKTAIIIPIRKSNGGFRPVSLTSCFCKMMERVIRNRLDYKIRGLFSENLNGFIKGKSTADCIIKVLGNNKSNYRLFVDLQNAFDKANKNIILEELVNKGISGNLLKWIKDYLSDRKGKVIFQGVESDVFDISLGTPQGGVLSPILFNVLMDRIAIGNDVQTIIYADDIVIQCHNFSTMQNIGNQIQELCINFGLIININKSKYQSRIECKTDLVMNNLKLQKVQSYKYLGFNIGFKYNYEHIAYVKNLCISRLKPLRILANCGKGIGWYPIVKNDIFDNHTVNY
ncbi:uncharacterized protein LOC135195962 [Macrobrachium nipponense]|uniref:uncharacterized protein LOC135195962 n=1 Tax=Macrobrachium nipponense TaxID=159736 RepID=UPI0030C8A2B2